MDVLIVVAAGLAGVVLGVSGVLAARARRRSWFERCVSSRVLVHTSDDQTWEGVLVDVAADGVRLAAVRLVDGDVAVAGDVWVPRAKVVMVQRPPVGA